MISCLSVIVHVCIMNPSTHCNGEPRAVSPDQVDQVITSTYGSGIVLRKSISHLLVSINKYVMNTCMSSCCTKNLIQFGSITSGPSFHENLKFRNYLKFGTGNGSQGDHGD